MGCVPHTPKANEFDPHSRNLHTVYRFVQTSCLAALTLRIWKQPPCHKQLCACLGTSSIFANHAAIESARVLENTKTPCGPALKCIHAQPSRCFGPDAISYAMLQMIMSLLMDKGDTILCESYTYPHMIESLVIPRGFRVQGVEADGEGIIPGALSKDLEQHTAQGGKPPRLLYTVPVGQNPTGIACTSAVS